MKLLLSPLRWQKLKNKTKYHCTRINQKESHLPDHGQMREREKEREGEKWGIKREGPVLIEVGEDCMLWPQN